MGLVVSLILIAVGAILTFAVKDTSNAINLDAVGIVLMIVGAIGFLLDLLLWSSWGPGYMRRSTVAAAPVAAAPVAAAPVAPVAATPVAPAAPVERQVVVEEEGPVPPAV